MAKDACGLAQPLGTLRPTLRWQTPRKPGGTPGLPEHHQLLPREGKAWRGSPRNSHPVGRVKRKPPSLLPTQPPRGRRLCPERSTNLSPKQSPQTPKDRPQDTGTRGKSSCHFTLLPWGPQARLPVRSARGAPLASSAPNPSPSDSKSFQYKSGKLHPRCHPPPHFQVGRGDIGPDHVKNTARAARAPA